MFVTHLVTCATCLFLNVFVLTFVTFVDILRLTAHAYFVEHADDLCRVGNCVLLVVGKATVGDVVQPWSLVLLVVIATLGRAM